VSANPIHFTVEFRRKMAELTQEQRLEWLSSLARRVDVAATHGPPCSPRRGDVFSQQLHEVARGCRLALVESVEKQFGPFDRRLLDALLEVGRERFVRPEDVVRSADDVPLGLDDRGLATISAPHAYLLSYRLLRLSPGDTLVELGTGSGYGAALAAQIVGIEGSVLSFEIDAALVGWARAALATEPAASTGPIRVTERDAMESTGQWEGTAKVAVTFAVEALPPDWLRTLPEGGMLVAPVGPRDQEQRLVLATRRRGRVVESDHGAVRYVRNRSGGDNPRR
jgi:protein-L-isoaspartate(D-aspartate) O-methyltransferase